MKKLTSKIRVTILQKRIDTFAAFGVVEARDEAIAFQRHLTGEIVLWRNAKASDRLACLAAHWL